MPALGRVSPTPVAGEGGAMSHQDADRLDVMMDVILNFITSVSYKNGKQLCHQKASIHTWVVESTPTYCISVYHPALLALEAMLPHITHFCLAYLFV